MVGECVWSLLSYLRVCIIIHTGSSWRLHSFLLESGSARFNADQMTRTVQARIESNKTSQGVTSGGTLIYSREPNRKNSIFIGNLTWVRSSEFCSSHGEASLVHTVNLIVRVWLHLWWAWVLMWGLYVAWIVYSSLTLLVKYKVWDSE